jgi:GntR family transcriptional regulator
MLSFNVKFESGAPVYDQVVYAVKRAIVTGQLRAGDRFPSVRKISQELKINPNTAHKAVAALIEEGLLEALPGIGTIVAKAPAPTREQKHALLDKEIERVIVEAKKFSLEIDDVVEAIRHKWKKLNQKERL